MVELCFVWSSSEKCLLVQFAVDTVLQQLTRQGGALWRREQRKQTPRAPHSGAGTKTVVAILNSRAESCHTNGPKSRAISGTTVTADKPRLPQLRASRCFPIASISSRLTAVLSFFRCLSVVLTFSVTLALWFSCFLSLSLLPFLSLLVFSLSLSVSLRVCCTRGRGLAFSSARVRVRAHVDGPGHPPTDAGDHTLCEIRALMPSIGLIAPACVSSPRDWAVSEGSHMEQNTVITY